MSNNLIHITAHNNQELTLPHGIHSWRLYAKKYNIDFHVSNRHIDADFKPAAHCAFKKWQEPIISESGYDRVLVVDSDVIVRWDAPNIFDTYADVDFGMVQDAGGVNTGIYHINQWKESFDIPSSFLPNFYCNTGIVLLSKNNYDIVSSNILPYFEFWKTEYEKNGKHPDAIDQTPVNIIGWKHCKEVELLNPIWNNMVMAKYNDFSFLNDSYVWHFTGPLMGGWGNKSNIMNTVWAHIKEYYN